MNNDVVDVADDFDDFANIAVDRYQFVVHVSLFFDCYWLVVKDELRMTRLL